MRFEPEEIVLKDGRKCILRNASKEDAEGMIAYMKGISKETDFVLRYPDEVTFTVQSEIEILEAQKDAPGSFMMVAIVDGEIAGNCSINGLGSQRKIRHRAGFAIALYEKYWNLGIGGAMMRKSLELAKEMRYEQVELEVVAKNERAIHLYEKYGYQKYGERPNALKLDQGGYMNEYQMIRML